MSDDPATLRNCFDWFTRETGEVPETVIFDTKGPPWRPGPRWPGTPEGLIAWADVPDQILDRVFDSSYGGNESPDLCARSPSWVLFMDNYDGAESLQWVPRNPTVHDPIRPGGG